MMKMLTSWMKKWMITMETKFILIDTCNRETDIRIFYTKKEAQDALLEIFKYIVNRNNLNFSNREECWVDSSRTYAYANTKYFQYDWRVFEV